MAVSSSNQPRQTKPRIYDFDPHRLAETETAMWRAYYDKQPLALFRLSLRLLHEQLGFSRRQVLINAYRLTLAAFVFKRGRVRQDYLKALRWLVPFYRTTRRHLSGRWDPRQVAELELEWWIIHRHDFGPGQTARLEEALARLCAVVYHLPEAELDQFARARAAAMLVTDEGVRARQQGSPVEPDWATIHDHLETSYTSLSRLLRQRTTLLVPTD